MITLTVSVEEALLERIADVAQARGEETEQIVVEVLRQAFRAKSSENSLTLDDEMLAVLAPFWAEQDSEQGGNPTQVEKGTPGDAVEEYLARHWADDIRKSSMNR